MGITKLPTGRWRVQVRRKGLPVFDKVFATKTEASAALMEREVQPPARGKSTLRELWEQYADSYEFESKSANTRATERCRIQPVLAVLGHYSLHNL